MPGDTPARWAFSFTAKIFCSGALPSRTATNCERNSGSARSNASTGKSGTKMQAKGIKSSVFGCQLSGKLPAISYQLCSADVPPLATQGRFCPFPAADVKRTAFSLLTDDQQWKTEA